MVPVRPPSASFYLQNGQQPPELATLVAAGAAVANSPAAAAINARSLVFMARLLTGGSLKRRC